jgi:hypothetical protein
MTERFPRASEIVTPLTASPATNKPSTVVPNSTSTCLSSRDA